MKFKICDIVVKPGNNSPIIILGEHTFPDGSKAYRMRICLPQYDLVDETEHWDKQDGYLHQSYVDENYELVWSKSNKPCDKSN